jgi:hypothetical protein
VVALEHKVLVYNFADLKLLHQVCAKFPPVHVFPTCA